MSSSENLDRALEGPPGPGRGDDDAAVDAEPQEREAVEEATPAPDEEEVERRARPGGGDRA